MELERDFEFEFIKWINIIKKKKGWEVIVQPVKIVRKRKKS